MLVIYNVDIIINKKQSAFDNLFDKNIILTFLCLHSVLQSLLKSQKQGENMLSLTTKFHWL